EPDCVVVPISGAFPDFAIDADLVRQHITTKTRAILLNSPNNPTGRIVTVAELESLAAIAEEYDLLVISDEIYGDLVLGDRPHVSISSLPGMLERTLVVDGTSKSYSM